MKHRSYALLLAAALSVSLLAGCGSQNNDQSSSDTSSSNQSSQSVSSGSSVSTSGSMSGSASTSGSGSTSTPDASQNETQEQAKLTLSRTGFTLFSAGESYTLKTDGVPSGTKVTLTSRPSMGDPLGRPAAQTISADSPNRGWDPTDPAEGNPWRT